MIWKLRLRWHLRRGHLVRIKTGDYPRCTCGVRLGADKFPGWDSV